MLSTRYEVTETKSYGVLWATERPYSVGLIGNEGQILKNLVGKGV